jgi:hypothetical protein
MPTSTIPYDPSLVLGMVIDPAKIEQLEKIADAQNPVDLARDKVNALIRQKLSIDMTVRELVSLGASSDQLEDISKNSTEILKDIADAATDLSKLVITVEKQIFALKSEQGQKQIGSQVQSPLDLQASQLKPLPISSDTLNMDVQYFRYEENEDGTSSHSTSVSTFVGIKVSSFLGPTVGAQAGAAARATTDSASTGRSLLGTVVICVNCTHKQAQVFSPMVIDPESAMENYVTFTGKKWGEKPGDAEDPDAMLELAMAEIKPEDEAKGMPVLVGATYGSSFVGFVHFERVEDTSSSQSSSSVSTQASISVERNLFLASMQGSFAVDAETSSSLKSLLSTSDVQSHCSLICMGIIPTIKSSNIETVVKALQSTPQERMEQLAAMQGASNSGMQSMASAAKNAKTGQSIEQMNTDYIKASVSAVGDVDNASNLVIDMNSMMTAFDDYVSKVSSAEGGVPINFYIRRITQRSIAVAWMEKYFPDMLHAKKHDGTEESK